MLSRSNGHLETFPKDISFAANVAFYPVCWAYNKIPGYELIDVSESPLLILTGEHDDYDTPTSCIEWRSSLTVNDQNNVDIVVYPNTAHGFNTSAASATVIDPFSHQGKGGTVIMETNEDARELANKAQLEFFLQHLNPQ
jgi:dienelactone hydrolase